MTATPLLISREEVQELLDWDSLCVATREGLIVAANPPPGSATSVQVVYSDGSLHLKAASLEPQRIISVKSNLRPSHGGVSGLLLAYDLDTEQISGIIDASLMTALRTGAIAAVAAEHFVRERDVRVAVLGVGPVGEQSIRGLLRTLAISEVRLWSSHGRRSQQLADQLARTVRTLVCQTVNEAIANADVIVTATPTTEPILVSPPPHDGTLILAMGADTVGKRELSANILRNADIIADVPDDAIRVGESAYLEQSRWNEVSALGHWLATDTVPPLHRPLLVVDSVGSSHVDAAVTSVIMTRARDRGESTSVEL